MTFTVQQCKGCLHTVYPARYLCPDCQRSDWRPIPVSSATLLQFTHLPGPRGDAYLGTLETDAGPIVIARLAGADHSNGRRYALRLENDALIAERQSLTP